MKLSELKEGCEIELDAGFTCIDPGPVLIQKDNKGLFFKCKEGNHYLDGQVGENGHLIGVVIK